MKNGTLEWYSVRILPGTSFQGVTGEPRVSHMQLCSCLALLVFCSTA